MKLTVAQLAERIGAELVGNGSGQIGAVGAVGTAGESDVTFITNDKHIPRLKKSRVGAVIVGRCIEGLSQPQLIVKNVDAALIETLNVFAPKLKAAAEGIDPTAKVGQNVKIAKGVSVGAGVVIDDGVEIGENSVIASGCKIGENSKLGKNCRLDSNVVVYHNCTIGNNVIIQANSTIGSTGFGYSFIDGSHKLIPHNQEIAGQPGIDEMKLGYWSASCRSCENRAAEASQCSRPRAGTASSGCGVAYPAVITQRTQVENLSCPGRAQAQEGCRTCADP